MIEDSEWIPRLKSNGPERDQAITELRTFLLRGLTKSLNNRYGRGFNAEDIVQEALIKVLDSLDQFEGRSRFTTWSMTIAIRLGLSALRGKHHQELSLDAFRDNDSHSIELAVTSEDHHGEISDRSELIGALQKVINEQLTAKQRFVIQSLLAGDTTDGVAAALDSNRNAVHKLLHDARVKLKKGLHSAGYTGNEILAAIQ